MKENLAHLDILRAEYLSWCAFRTSLCSAHLDILRAEYRARAVTRPS